MRNKRKRVKKNLTPTPEFKILRERLKESIGLKLSGKYSKRDFDKLVDKL